MNRLWIGCASSVQNVWKQVKDWTRLVRRDVHALYLASRDPRMPWYAKALAACVAGYALSPIDLIPDFIPIIGYLDDVILVPAGIWLVIRLIPTDVMEEHRALADAAQDRPIGKRAALVVVAIWIAAAIGLGWMLYRHLVSS